MARARGANAIMAASFETTYGTPPSTGYRKLPFVSSNLGEEQGLIPSDLLGYPLITPLVFSGSAGTTGIPAGVTRYFTAGSVQTTWSLCYQPAGRRGRFSKLRVATPGPPGAGESWTITLQKLFSDTVLSCTITGTGSNSGADLVNSVPFEADDRWCLKIVSSAGAAPTNAVLFSMVFEAID